MPVKQYADTSAVAIAYAIDNAANADELQATEFTFVPFTTEGFTMSKESEMSAAISGDRRPSGSKNTRGSASGSAGMELGYTPFILDMLKLSLMSDWEDEVEEDGEGASVPTGAKFMVDGESLNFFVAEKRIRNAKDGEPMNYFRRFYGNLVNQADVEIGDGLASFTVNTMAAFADLNEAQSTADNENAGGLANTYKIPEPYEIADGANNVESITLRDPEGTPLEVTFTSATLSITNNVREQPGVGHEFSAGMAMGKVNVSLSGDIYYYDETVLKAHMDSDFISAEVKVRTADGSLTFHLPATKAEAPDDSAQGENQDYTQSLTLNAERGEVSLNGENRACVLAVIHEPANTSEG